MLMRIKLKGGDEYDALTKAKKFCFWKPGERKKIKRGYNKRLRKCAYDGGRNRIDRCEDEMEFTG
jgi:hypothetical protein